MFKKNIQYIGPMELSPWRKIAIGTWKTAADPSVYGVLDLPAEAALAFIEDLKKKSGKRITLTHFVGKAVAETLRRHPDINCILRFGRLYQRKAVDIFYQVAADAEGKDLSGMTIRNADTKSIVEIAQEMEDRVAKIRAKTDTTFTKVKGIMGAFPGFLSGLLLDFTGLIMYTLNIWSPLLGSPRDPFGSAMVTSIGSLGLDLAFAPLVPYSRVPMVLAVGAVNDVALVKDGQVVAGKTFKLCVTFDHRLIDGLHASKMAKAMFEICRDPQKHLG